MGLQVQQLLLGELAPLQHDVALQRGPSQVVDERRELEFLERPAPQAEFPAQAQAHARDAVRVVAGERIGRVHRGHEHPGVLQVSRPGLRPGVERAAHEEERQQAQDDEQRRTRDRLEPGPAVAQDDQHGEHGGEERPPVDQRLHRSGVRFHRGVSSGDMA